jgi:hypothetical protein
MTFRRLSDDCWRELPAFRKHLYGRAAVNRILADAVLEFDPTVAAGAGYAETLLGAVKRRNTVKACRRCRGQCDDRDGFAVLTFVLATVAATVISWLIKRWLDNRFPQSDLQALKQELSG